MILKDLYMKSRELKILSFIGFIIFSLASIYGIYKLFFRGMLDTELLLIIIVMTTPLLIYIFYRTIIPIFDERIRHSAIIIKNDIEQARDRISYLKSRKEKYQVIVDSDLEELFKSI